MRTRLDQNLEKRDRELFIQAIAALKPPPPKWYNTPIALWIMSALFLSLTSAFFTQYRDCVNDGDELIGRFQRINRELASRHQANMKAIASANSLDDARRQLQAVAKYYVYREFMDRTTIELSEDAAGIRPFIDWRDVSIPIYLRSSEFIDADMSEVKWSTIIIGEIPAGATDDEFRIVRDYAKKEAGKLTYVADSRLIQLKRTCGPITVFQRTFGFHVQHIFADDTLLKQVMSLVQKFDFLPKPDIPRSELQDQKPPSAPK